MQTWNLDRIGAQAAYNRGFTGAGVTVTVGDTGFDTTNAGLVNKLLINLGKNYVVRDGGVFDPNDLSPRSAVKTDIHGSHVSGIIAGEKFDNVDAHGVAYNANIIPLRVVTEAGYSIAGDTDPSAAALNYFAGLAGTMVYNASYGPNNDAFTGLTQWSIGEVSDEANAAMNVLKAGKIIVAANGNDRRKNPEAARNPSGLALLPFLNPAHDGLGVYDDQGQKLDGTPLQHQNGQIIAVMSVGITKARGLVLEPVRRHRELVRCRAGRRRRTNRDDLFDRSAKHLRFRAGHLDGGADGFGRNRRADPGQPELQRTGPVASAVFDHRGPWRARRRRRVRLRPDPAGSRDRGPDDAGRKCDGRGRGEPDHLLESDCSPPRATSARSGAAFCRSPAGPMRAATCSRSSARSRWTAR